MKKILLAVLIPLFAVFPFTSMSFAQHSNMAVKKAGDEDGKHGCHC